MNKKWIPWDDRFNLREYSIVFYNAEIVKIFGNGNLCNGDHIRDKHACSMLVNLKNHWNEKQSLLVKIGRIPDHILTKLLYCKELEDMENRNRPPILRSIFHNNSAFDKCFSSDTREIFRYLEYDYIFHELNDNVYKRALIWEGPDGDDGIYYQEYSFPRPVEESPYIVPILTRELRKGFRKLEAIDEFDFDNNDVESVSAVLASVLVDNDLPADNITAKPKRRKATKKETLDAADLIIKYFNSGKRKFSISIIKNYLKNELGINFDLSSKTFLGKVYAVMYYKTKKIPPRGWTVGKVEETEKETRLYLSRK